MKVHTSVLVICLILAVVCSGAIKVLHHDRLDGFVANEHIDWTTSAQDFNTTGDITLGGYIDIPEMTIPGTPGTNYLRLYNEDIHGFSFFSFKDDTGMVRKLVRDSVIVVKNERGSAIAAGRIVYATGSENTVPTVDLAKADSSSTMPAIGVTLERIVDGAYGRVMQTGLLENVNTNSFSTGDVLYVSDTTAGIPKSTVPVTPSLSQEIGTILVSDSTAGQIQIVSRSVHQNETGTAQNTFLIGDGTSDGKTLTFNAITDGSIIWDETKFDLDGAPLYTSNSGRFDGGVGIGADPTVISLLNITSSHADRTAIRINNTSTGNPVVQFALSGTVNYVMGIDDSDSDKFKISSGTTLGAPTLIMDSAINLSGIGTITSSGAYNTLHIVEGTTASHPVWANYACLSGDGTEHDGLSIQIPYTAGNDFYYGYGGTEDHYFGQSSDLQITSDGNIATAGTIGCGTITATANSDVLLSGTGHVTSGSEGFIVGTLTITDGSIDDTDGSIAFGDTNFTGVGTIIAASYNAITLAVNDLVIDDAANDNSLTVSGDWTIDQSVASGATPTFGADNFSDGGSNAIVTTTQETNWDNHIADNTQAHSDYLINDGNDSTSGILTAASFETVNYFDGGGFRHIGDLDTYCGLLTDRIVFFAGGNSMIESRWHAAVGAFRKITFNSGSADIDVEMRGDTDNNLLYLNAGTDRVGIGTATPAAKFDVVGDALISTTLGVTGIATFSDDVIIDSDTKSLQLGDDQDIELYSDTAGELSLKKAADSDIKIVFEADNEGSIQWMEDALQFDFNGHIQIQKDSGTAPFIKVNSTLSGAGDEVYVETNYDSGGTPVMARLESKQGLAKVGTFSAHEFHLVYNDFTKLKIDTSGYVRVIDRLMVGADAAPTVALDVTGDIHASGWIRSSDADYRRYYHLSVGGFDPGASGATWIDPDGDTTGGWQLNTSAEKLIAGTDIHSDWDGVSDIMAEMRFALNNTAGGDPNVDLQLIAYYNGIGDTSTKTQTVEVITDTDGTQYKVYSVEFTLDYDATDNVIEAGDHITFILNLETDTSEIDDIIITEGTFYYNTTHTGIESGDT